MNAIHTDNAPAAIGPYSEVYAEFFSQPYPARSAVAVEKLPKGALVEVEVLAAK